MIRNYPLDLIEDVFTGLYNIIWNPTQPVVINEAWIIGKIVSSTESEV